MTVDTDIEAADRAAAYWLKIKTKYVEDHWSAIIFGLGEMRKQAMLNTRSNDVMSGRYRAEFSRLRKLHSHLAKLSANEVSGCCWAAENPGLYEAVRMGMNAQSPTPYGVYQRAMRLARANRLCSGE